MNANELNLVTKIILHTATTEDFYAVSENVMDIIPFIRYDACDALEAWGIRVSDQDFFSGNNQIRLIMQNKTRLIEIWNKIGKVKYEVEASYIT